MANKLKFLILHCSATNSNLDIKTETIKNYHMNTLGWSRPGYRSVIELDGKIVKLVDANDNDIVENDEMTFGVRGMNRWSHHICYVGGIDSETHVAKDTRTDAQKKSMEAIVKYYVTQMNPDILIAGHNQFDNKSCPSFWTPDWLREIGIPEKNIYDENKYGYKGKLRKVNK